VGRQPKVARPRNLGLNDSIPLGLAGTLRCDVPAGAFPFLASGISAGPPGTGKRGQADGAARHPYHGATPKTATGTGALPGNVPVGGRAPAPANGSLGWTNGAKGG